MPIDANAQTAILYEHPLLGEGIAAHLRRALGIHAVLASASDPDAVLSTLALDPRVVIFERAGVLCEQELAALAPHAAFIDVSSAVCQGTPAEDASVDLDRVASAVSASLESNPTSADR